MQPDYFLLTVASLGVPKEGSLFGGESRRRGGFRLMERGLIVIRRRMDYSLIIIFGYF